ncbi:MAG: exodeoxyribonuclease V subunit gamma [Lachnospiraceae bacterium]|nr:exodeoxyribonuclease V subunit gamma [Lachnospiraceae bacterium]
MALRFYFGPSDGALSQKAYREVIARSMEYPETNFLVIVPDQFTMQTQKELATMHPRGGILNIDVLSFGRLSHRVLEEVDCREIPVLDDTGKSLVLQKVQANLKDQLPVLGGFMHKQGYVHEVKSAISEFMQYGLSPKDVGDLIEFSKDKAALSRKLRDLQTIYKGFQEYIQDHFVTAEETLDILCRNLSESKLVRNAVILLDGYTGFTPIQYRLVRELVRVGAEVTITLVIGEGEDPYRLSGEQGLFYLTQKTVSDLERILKDDGVTRDRGADVRIEMAARQIGAAPTAGPAQEPGLAPAGTASTQSSPASELSFLTKHIFRYDAPAYAGDDTGEIHLFEMTNPAAEVHQVALQIQRLIREKHLSYRDFVLLTGKLEEYAPHVEAEFARLEIPCYIDETRSITLNPLTEFMLAALSLSLKNYSYESVFHYLRSGLAGIPQEEVDRLENYVLEMGIRGRKAWFQRFTRKTKIMRLTPKDEAPLEALNRTREAFAAQVAILSGKAKDSASNYVERLYEFLVNAGAPQELSRRAKAFEEAGDAARAKEYSQIWRYVCELLEQIHGLLGQEEVTLQEFSDVVSAGLGEIQVGTIPQGVDRILLGDMERTRFKPVKVLFFLGVNDGIIPRNTSKGGILSDIEREFLKDSRHALAPTPRQQAFIQRFYLYLNLTKPTQALYLTFSRQDSDGKAIRPAYLIDVFSRMFPKLDVEQPQRLPVLEQILTPTEGKDLLAASLRDYAGGVLPKERESELYTLCAAYADEEQGRYSLESYIEAAFLRSKDKRLAKAIAKLAYGQILFNSVSRLETYAACAYKHFLRYGLALSEREEYGFEAVDLGNVYHSALEKFSKGLADAHETWFTFDEDYAKATMATVMGSVASIYGGEILKDNYRLAYQAKRMERILVRTVLTLQKQLKKGVFTPQEYEMKFDTLVHLGEGGSDDMKLQGRIDRYDTAEDDDNVYVKVMDYKSGSKQVDLVALYHGLQLQLVVYLNQAIKEEQKKHPDKKVQPAALLYYHVEDPVIEEKKMLSDEELSHEIDKALCAKGYVNDDKDVIKLLAGEFTDASDAIPVRINKDGNVGKNSSVLNREGFAILSSYVDQKIQSMAGEIMDGNVALNPYQRGDGSNAENSCKYCPYGGVCGLDLTIPGTKVRQIPNEDEAYILARMKHDLGLDEEESEQ